MRKCSEDCIPCCDYCEYVVHEVIGYDYDGCHSADDLKKVIDNLVEMANNARDCLRDGKLFGVHGGPVKKDEEGEE